MPLLTLLHSSYPTAFVLMLRLPHTYVCYIPVVYTYMCVKRVGGDIRGPTSGGGAGHVRGVGSRYPQLILKNFPQN